MVSATNDPAPDPLIYSARSITLDDPPKVDAHLHTTWTDGKCTVQEVHAHAVALGLRAILYSEHSRKTSVDWFPRFAAEVRSLSPQSCQAFVGTEVRVSSQDGEIDTVPEIRDLCDYIIASVHRFPDAQGEGIPFTSVTPEEAIDREYGLSWRVLEHPDVHILGHMFGMCYRKFKVQPPAEKIRSLIRHAAQHKVAVEINSQYHPNRVQMLEWCQEFDALITLGSDAHVLQKIGDCHRFP
jgi:histidinol phosphatase-like PHP family hydrolase